MRWCKVYRSDFENFGNMQPRFNTTHVFWSRLCYGWNLWKYWGRSWQTDDLFLPAECEWSLLRPFGNNHPVFQLLPQISILKNPNHSTNSSRHIGCIDLDYIITQNFKQIWESRLTYTVVALLLYLILVLPTGTGSSDVSYQAFFISKYFLNLTKFSEILRKKGEYKNKIKASIR